MKLEQLKKAVVDGDLDKVKTLFKQLSVDVNTVICCSETALHIASQHGHVKVAKYLLKNGALVNKLNSSNQSTLYSACVNGHVKMARYLLDNDVLMNVGENPLTAAVQNNRYDCVKLLLEHHANADCCNSAGESPLSIALQRPRYSRRHQEHEHELKVKLILLLLQYHATLLPSLKHISSELLMNAEAQHAKAIQRLIDANFIDLKCEAAYFAAFNYAFTHGPMELAEKVISNGDYSKIKQLHTKALYYSAKNNWPRILLKQLVERSDINALTYGQTPLYAACEEGHEFIVSLLLKNGADPNIQNNSAEMPFSPGITYVYRFVKDFVCPAFVSTVVKNLTFPLHVAVHHGSANIVEMLLKSGALLNPPGEPLLHIACSDASECKTTDEVAETRSVVNKLSVIRMLLQQGVDANAISDKGDTALYRACISQQLDVALILLGIGADANLTSNKLYPLIAASEAGNAELVDLLVTAGADVKCVTRDNETCLHAIVSFSRSKAAMWKTAGEGETSPMEHNVMPSIVKLLLRQGVDVNAISGHGDTALYRACMSQQLEVVQILLEGGADVNLTSNKLYPLMAACEVGNAEIIHLLVKAGTDMKCSNGKNETSLHAAVNACASMMDPRKLDAHRIQRQEVVKRYMLVAEMLLSAGVDINQVDRSGASALYLACVIGETEFVKLLLSHGADPNTRSGMYAILAACRDCHYDVVKLLLDYNADVAVFDDRGNTALHCVLKNDKSQQKQAELIELLLDQGANVNEVPNGGETPFYIACQQGLESVAKKMLECGAKVNGRSDDKLPLKIACKNEHESVIQLLLTNGANPNLKVTSLACDNSEEFYDTSDDETSFHIACSKGLESVAKTMLEYGADVNGNSVEFLPLNAACKNGHIPVVQLLLTNGANPDLKEISYYDPDDCDHEISYPLCTAAAGDKVAIVELLLKHGANADIDQCSPLCDAIKRMIAEVNDFTCHSTIMDKTLSTIRLLLQHGANVNTLMRNGKTPLNVIVNVNTIADGGKYVDKLLQLMVKYGAVLQDFYDDNDDDDDDYSQPEDPNVLKALATFAWQHKFIVDVFRAGAEFQLLARCCNAVACSPRAKSIDLCQAAVLAGYRPSVEELHNLQLEADRRGRHGCSTVSGALTQQLVNWLNEDREQVPSLRRQCRIAIRRQCSVAANFKTVLPAVEQMAKQLHLPRIVKEYLQFDGPLNEVDFSTTDQLLSFSPFESTTSKDSDSDDSEWCSVFQPF